MTHIPGRGMVVGTENSSRRLMGLMKRYYLDKMMDEAVDPETHCTLCSEPKNQEEQNIGRDLCFSCYCDTEGRE